jgi:predicted  nucleic acid-binding Zn-ribbon protein
MLKIHSGCYEHDKYKKLGALAAAGNLAPLESAELHAHLGRCEQCHEAFRQYLALTTQGVAILADEFAERPGLANWDKDAAFEQLLERIERAQHPAPEKNRTYETVPASKLLRGPVRSIATMLLAAGLILTVVLGSYLLRIRTHSQSVSNVTAVPLPIDDRLQRISEEKQQADEALVQQTKELAQLQTDEAQKEQELGKLRSALRAFEDRANKLQAASSQSEAQLLALSQERDSLTTQLQTLNQSYGVDRTELANLRLERDKTVTRTASLEAKIAELASANKDQERRLKDTDQYLSSDRDIRELMGARKLYIADVFDVDGSSRTQKPFGRVFYTQGKSLIFYAFDLDREPGVVNASTFQVWGQREAPQGQQESPMNLGILYMDNESNRRWVMRFDDPKKLAEIDAVFVTVEPRGGSHKPTNKPFLYALLRNQANHP